MKQDDFIRLLHGVQHGFFIERQQGAQIHDLEIDAFFFEFLGCLQRDVHHRTVGDDADVGPRPANGSLADGYDKVVRGKLFLYPPIKELVLEIDDRIGVPDRGLDQSLGIVRRGGANHFQARRVHKIHFGILRMERSAVNTAATGSADNNRDACAPAVTALGREIRDLIEGAGNEVRELHLSDRPHSHQRCADGGPHDGGF